MNDQNRNDEVTARQGNNHLEWLNNNINNVTNNNSNNVLKLTNQRGNQEV